MKNLLPFITVIVLSAALTYENGLAAGVTKTNEPALPDLSQKPVINGIDPKSAAAFWDKWHLVTVRYRKDNGEQRFIYANDIAWQSLRDGKQSFTDGAMLGKIAFATKVDPAFPSSVETGEYTRVQLMKKDRKKFAKTGGWSYAIFVANTPTNSAEDSSVVAACHACHNLVPDRDSVFSRPSLAPQKSMSPQWGNTTVFKDRFQRRKREDLSPFSRAVLSVFQGPVTAVHYLSLPLFVGSLSEATNPMITVAKDVAEPLILVDEEHGLFFIAKSVPSSPACPVTGVEFFYRTSTQKTANKSEPGLRRGFACGDQFTWSTSPLPTAISTATEN